MVDEAGKAALKQANDLKHANKESCEDRVTPQFDKILSGGEIPIETMNKWLEPFTSPIGPDDEKLLELRGATNKQKTPDFKAAMASKKYGSGNTAWFMVTDSSGNPKVYFLTDSLFVTPSVTEDANLFRLVTNSELKKQVMEKIFWAPQERMDNQFFYIEYNNYHDLSYKLEGYEGGNITNVIVNYQHHPKSYQRLGFSIEKLTDGRFGVLVKMPRAKTIDEHLAKLGPDFQIFKFQEFKEDILPTFEYMGAVKRHIGVISLRKEKFHDFGYHLLGIIRLPPAQVAWFDEVLMALELEFQSGDSNRQTSAQEKIDLVSTIFDRTTAELNFYDPNKHRDWVMASARYWEVSLLFTETPQTFVAKSAKQLRDLADKNVKQTSSLNAYIWLEDPLLKAKWEYFMGIVQKRAQHIVDPTSSNEK